MGIRIIDSTAYYEYNNDGIFDEFPEQVLYLAQQSIGPLLQTHPSATFSHVIVATTCPDSLTPSLGQRISQQYTHVFSHSHVIDIVQGCAGGVTALILGSQLALLNKSNVMVVQADAARKATSQSSLIHQIFGNGSFACLLSYDASAKGLLHYQSRQYAELTEVVRVRLGHDAHQVIGQRDFETKDPRKYLGLHLNEKMAVRLMKKAEKFYLDFVDQSGVPDILILHQVNPLIIGHLKSVFSKYPVAFVDVAAQTGNCGAASVGIALHQVRDETAGKKVMLCSFGTGGVITAGLWQM